MRDLKMNMPKNLTKVDEEKSHKIIIIIIISPLIQYYIYPFTIPPSTYQRNLQEA